mgnify:CR=1 FL=1
MPVLPVDPQHRGVGRAVLVDVDVEAVDDDPFVVTDGQSDAPQSGGGGRGFEG